MLQQGFHHRQLAVANRMAQGATAPAEMIGVDPTVQEHFGKSEERDSKMVFKRLGLDKGREASLHDK